MVVQLALLPSRRALWWLAALAAGLLLPLLGDPCPAERCQVRGHPPWAG